MKKKTHPRIPRGYGSIKYMGKNRKNPYAVYVPQYHVSETGNLIYNKALCYVPDWYTGFAVLVSYRAGTYHPGDEIKIAHLDRNMSDDCLDDFCAKILKDMSIATAQSTAPTFKELADEWHELKFGEYAPRKLSIRSEQRFYRAIKAFEHLNDRKLDQISAEEIQTIINEKSKVQKRNSVEAILGCIREMLNFAVSKDYIPKSPCKLVYIPSIAEGPERADPFTLDELRTIILKARRGDEMAIALYIHCMSGFRITAYYKDDFEINTKEWYFRGGVKWDGGKDRIVPIHSAIIPFVLGKKSVYPFASTYVNTKIAQFCEQNGMRKRTSHDCRHTFKMLMDKFGVSDLAQRYMLGHTLGDIHNSVYSHLDTDDLRKEIEKIKIEVICSQ